MLVVVSPAKRLDETPARDGEGSRPRFPEATAELVETAAKLDAKGLEKLMHISPKLAVLNQTRFGSIGSGAGAKPAVEIFAGDTYTGLDAGSLDPALSDGLAMIEESTHHDDVWLRAMPRMRVAGIYGQRGQWDRAVDYYRAVIADLKDYGGPVAAMSFEPTSIVALRRLAPDLPRGIVAEAFTSGTAEISGLGAWERFYCRHLLHFFSTLPHFIAYRVQDLPAPAPVMLNTILAIPLLAWTVRTKADVERAKLTGAQMIFEGLTP